MTNNLVSYEVQGLVGLITLNRPEAHNSFNLALRLEFLDVLQQVAQDSQVRVVVLTGAGRSFSAGADLSDGAMDIERQIIEEYKPCLMAIRKMPKVVIAAVNGPAVGIGVALALACDLVALSKESFFSLTFAQLGLVADGGTSYHLYQRLGSHRAMELLLEARKISAAECLELGLVNRVVAAEQLQQNVMAWADKLAAGAPVSQKLHKQLLGQMHQLDLSAAIEQEAAYQQTCVETEDCREGISAFFDRRQPKFVGK